MGRCPYPIWVGALSPRHCIVILLRHCFHLEAKYERFPRPKMAFSGPVEAWIPETPVLDNAHTDNWNVDKSADLYRIRDWGAGYFDISEHGEVTISAPFGEQRATVKLSDIVSGMRERGYDTPVQLRIENLLDDRIAMLNGAFASAIADAGYRAEYRGVYPIKVNQQSHVVEQITRFGQHYHHGLEAGSKPELIVALALLRDTDSIIVCNGHKDAEFIDLGLRALQIGIRCFFVVETLAELPVIIERSRKLGVKPLIGFRLKLATKVSGHWQADSGERSIFGLSTIQMMAAVELLQRENMLDCLKMLHCHLGSQLPDIANIHAGVKEACRYYVELVKEGAPLGWLDLGGGLAVDYDGSGRADGYSMNYSLQEYCQSIVSTTGKMLDVADVEHPVLVTESGRATVAYSAILLFNILDVGHFDPLSIPDKLPDSSDPLVQTLFAESNGVTLDNVEACFDNAVGIRGQLRTRFAEGSIDLRELALAENIYYGLMQKIVALLPALKAIPEKLVGLRESRADIYYGNFSLFQSLPDNWGLQQLFPVMPIRGLAERPTREAIIADITCDCDGKMDRFIGTNGPSVTLPLHRFQQGDDYCLGVFLVGAYQETLGSLHNLFGDNNVVSVRINEDGSFDFVHELGGDDVDEVLRYVEYQPKYLLECFRNKAEKAVQDGSISAAERRQMLDVFSEGLRGYTYFER